MKLLLLIASICALPVQFLLGMDPQEENVQHWHFIEEYSCDNFTSAPQKKVRTRSGTSAEMGKFIDELIMLAEYYDIDLQPYQETPNYSAILQNSSGQKGTPLFILQFPNKKKTNKSSTLMESTMKIKDFVDETAMFSFAKDNTTHAIEGIKVIPTIIETEIDGIITKEKRCMVTYQDALNNQYYATSFPMAKNQHGKKTKTGSTAPTHETITEEHYSQLAAIAPKGASTNRFKKQFPKKIAYASLDNPLISLIEKSAKMDIRNLLD